MIRDDPWPYPMMEPDEAEEDATLWMVLFDDVSLQ